LHKCPRNIYGNEACQPAAGWRQSCKKKIRSRCIHVIQLQYISVLEAPVNKSATITVRLDPKVKKNAEAVLKALGLTTSQAVNLFFTQVSLNKGIPFDVHLPNEATTRAIEAGLAGRNLQSAAGMDDLIAQLEA
jgi:DNA-damage-inducible protein J